MASMSITDTGMSSTAGHTASLVDGADQYDKGAWIVSWCPERRFDRTQAITAITLADFVTSGVTGPSHRDWVFVTGWADELGLDVDEAVRMILEANS